jgi:hypothetical protein
MEKKLTVKKSIFKQEIYRKIYNFLSNTCENKYSLYGNYNSYININYEKIKEEEIFTLELEMPLLNEGEEFYIEELNKTVKILKRIRSSKENVCYYVEREIIEDEETIRTKERCEKIQEKYEENKKFKEQVENSFWFKFIKMI